MAKVTIAIPTYNRAHLVLRAVKSALEQTFGDIEVLVSDNCSTDGTRDILSEVRDPRLRVVSHGRNIGMTPNFMSCPARASGEYLLWLCDDDFLEPGCVETLLGAFESHEGVSMAYGQFNYFKDGKKEVQAGEGPEVEEGIDFIIGNFNGKRKPLIHSTLYRTEDLKKMTVPADTCMGDMVIMNKIALLGKVAHVKAPVTNFVLHPGSFSQGLDYYLWYWQYYNMFKIFLEDAEKADIPRKGLRDMERKIMDKCSVMACVGLLSSAGKKGYSKAQVIGEVRRLFPLIKYRPVVNMPFIVAAVCVPAQVINGARIFFKNIHKTVRPR